ncbi:phosphate-starvation-inducible protein PsiE [Bacillus toyonensis]|uniref:phosphate-starvation-inducible protein PsiE n=1 Tax=Bacillus toyonensis TaxID=155322 RepID=UPI003F656EF2
MCSKGRETRTYKNLFLGAVKAVMHKKELYPIYITGICMISLQMVLVGHFINFLVMEQSITSILAGKVFSVMFFSGMIGRITLAAVSDLFYKGNRRIPLYISVCTSIGCILMLVISIHTITSEFLYLVSALLGFFSIGWFSLFIIEVAETASQFIQELKLNGEESSYHLINSIVVFFLYFEFIVMIIKYFQMNFHFPLRYFIYIGITAIVRLIIINHDSPIDILLYACAIFVLISALFIANSKIMRRDLE